MGTPHPGSGNGWQWASTAATNHWSVTTIPMPDSIVVFPAAATNSAGHVAWVVSLDTNSGGHLRALARLQPSLCIQERFAPPKAHTASPIGGL